MTNNPEPAVSDVAVLDNDLRRHQAQLLFYNSQASDASAQRMVGIAQQTNVPIVGVTETEPAGTTFQDWIMGELNAGRSGIVQSPPERHSSFVPNGERSA